MFVADFGNCTIRRIGVATAEVTTLAGSPGHFGSADGTGASTPPPAWAVTTLAGRAGDSANVDGSADVARFSYPHSLDLDGAGHLFVADTGNDTIRQIDLATNVVSTLAGTGLPGDSDGTGILAAFNGPEAIAHDGAGHLFIAYFGNHAIREITAATSEVTTFVGAPQHAGVVLGPLPAGINSPGGVAMTPAGELLNRRERAAGRPLRRARQRGRPGVTQRSSSWG